MKVILVQDDKGLGSAGDVVDVRDGYARNLLIPKGRALPATDSALNELKARHAAEKRGEEKALKAAKETAARLESQELVFTRPAGKSGKLFGSLTPQTLSQTLKEKGFQVPKRQILLDKPVRSAGAYQAKVKLHPQVEAQLKLVVKAKSQ